MAIHGHIGLNSNRDTLMGYQPKSPQFLIDLHVSAWTTSWPRKTSWIHAYMYVCFAPFRDYGEMICFTSLFWTGYGIAHISDLSQNLETVVLRTPTSRKWRLDTTETAPSQCFDASLTRAKCGRREISQPLLSQLITHAYRKTPHSKLPSGVGFDVLSTRWKYSEHSGMAFFQGNQIWLSTK